MRTTAWRTEWIAISARIEGLVRAGEFFYRSIDKYAQDSYGVSSKVLLPQSAEVYGLIRAYAERFAAELPGQARACLDRFLFGFKSHFENSPAASTLDHALPMIQIRLAALSAFRSELEFSLSTQEDQIRAAAERAFLHLQRCIVVDARCRAQWKVAFQEGEMSCEKLGAVHLLWHGIWAFKVDAAGARTDLVMGSRIDNPSEAERAAAGMVLTEWKRATSPQEANQKYDEGKHQASRYSTGVLGGIELTSVRYVVMVTEDTLPPRPDIVEDGVAYRFLNVAVDPNTPSVMARTHA